ncbi:pentapeptide repeat-containing protein [Sulfurovum sp.]|uniref:pentapeptide repeat-containing protein n=1 Tax=Sulfurovum sp. TaxID=1969726 RepID=UPI0035613886
MNNKTIIHWCLTPVILPTPESHDCSVNSCQFNAFLNLQQPLPKFILNDDNGDTYCLFHTPKELQKKLSTDDEERQQALLEAYVTFCYLHDMDIDFSGVVLHDFKFPTEDRKYKKVNFSRAYFIGYPNFDGLHCEELILVDCIFERGSRFKNVQIEKLSFKPTKVKEAVVFETGGYIDKQTGLLIQNNNAYIKEVTVFKNHVEGDGKVFFVGCNFEEANFTNGMLDSLVFQTCNLKNAHFLNSKIDETEFRNCSFTENYERPFFTEIQGRTEKYTNLLGGIAIFLAVPFFWYTGLYEFLNTGLINTYLSILVVLVIWPALAFIAAPINLFLYIFNKYINRHINNPVELNKIQAGYHIAIADEFKLYKELSYLGKMSHNDPSFEKKKDQIKKSLHALTAAYLHLTKNFENTKDIQTAGNFFYSLRYTQIVSGQRDIIEMSILYFHYAVNGFGERFIRPLIWFMLTLFIVSISLKPNTHYIPTENTPYFLLQGYKEDVSSFKYTTGNTKAIASVMLETNSTLFNKKINHLSINIPQFDESNHIIPIYYSLAGVVSFFTPESKKWFQNKTPTASNLQFMEGIFSWFFLGAFILAIRNRIRRQ